MAPNDPRNKLICYCFSHTVGDIEDDFRQHGRSLILSSIIEAKKNGECRCQTTNPKGR